MQDSPTHSHTNLDVSAGRRSRLWVCERPPAIRFVMVIAQWQKAEPANIMVLMIDLDHCSACNGGRR